MNKTQVKVYKIIQKHSDDGKTLAEKYVGWCNALEERNDNQPAEDGTRGAVAGRLNEILSNLDSQVEVVREARHLFLWAVNRKVSTHALTQDQAKWILSRVTEAEGQGHWKIKIDEADDIRAMTIALIKGGAEWLIEEGKENMTPNAPDRAQGPPASPQTQGPPSGPQRQGPPSSPQNAPSGPQSDPPTHRVRPPQETENPTEGGDISEFVDAQWHDEAPVAATIRADINGYDVIMTIRAGASGEMVQQFMYVLDRSTSYLQRKGFHPIGGGHKLVGNDQPASQPSAPAAAGNPNNNILEQGTKTINSIQVDADGTVNYDLSGLRYPVKDSRGAEVVAGLCAEETQLGPDWFKPGTLITEAQMNKWYGQNLKAEYVKKKKDDKTYWDVTRVHL